MEHDCEQGTNGRDPVEEFNVPAFYVANTGVLNAYVLSLRLIYFP